MSKKKEQVVRFNSYSREKFRLPAPKPSSPQRAKCLCCNRSIPIRMINRNWVNGRYEDSENTLWYYTGVSYFCSAKCALVFATISGDKKLKINKYK